MEQNDSELVQKYLEGDKDALKTLVSRYIKPIYNFSYRLSGNVDEANDITQETFIKVWKNLKKFDQKKKFSTWIFAIARNTTIDWLRKKRPQLFSDLNHDDTTTEDFEHTIADTALLQHELFEKKESETLIENALAPLPPHYKTIILLYNNNDLTFEEIAYIVKKPMNTVKSQYRRGLIMMRENIENMHQNKAHKRTRHGE